MLFSLITVSFSAIQGASAPLTLHDSLEKALNNNTQLLTAQKDLLVARTQLRQARSLYYPRVQLDLNYIRYRNETFGLTFPDVGGATLALDPTDTHVTPVNRNLYAGRVGFKQTLYAGGKIETTLKLSKANLKRAERVYEVLKRDIEFKTTQTFFELLVLKQKAELLNESLASLEALAKNQPPSHTQMVMAMLRSNLRKRLTDIRNERDSIRLEYLQTMGIELFSEIEETGTLDLPPIHFDLQTALAWAKENRPELKETEVQQEVDQLAVQLSLAERYPVFLWGGAFELRDRQFPLDETNWHTLLSMNIPLFDGFSSPARIKESRYRADQGRLKRVQLEDTVEREVRSSFNDVEHWKDELGTRQRELANLLDAKRRHTAGGPAVPIREKLDYMEWELNAKTGVLEAQYQLCIATAKLAKSVGMPVLGR